MGFSSPSEPCSSVLPDQLPHGLVRTRMSVVSAELIPTSVPKHSLDWISGLFSLFCFVFPVCVLPCLSFSALRPSLAALFLEPWVYTLSIILLVCLRAVYPSGFRVLSGRKCTAAHLLSFSSTSSSVHCFVPRIFWASSLESYCEKQQRI